MRVSVVLCAVVISLVAPQSDAMFSLAGWLKPIQSLFSEHQEDRTSKQFSSQHPSSSTRSLCFDWFCRDDGDLVCEHLCAVLGDVAAQNYMDQAAAGNTRKTEIRKLRETITDMCRKSRFLPIEE